MNKKCKKKCRIRFLHIFNVIVCYIFIDIVFGMIGDCMSVMWVVDCEFWLGVLVRNVVEFCLVCVRVFDSVFVCLCGDVVLIKCWVNMKFCCFVFVGMGCCGVCFCFVCECYLLWLFVVVACVSVKEIRIGVFRGLMEGLIL
jgi:hypothetical protein